MLLDILEVVKGASEAVFEEVATEIQHLLPTPQVGAPQLLHAFLQACMGACDAGDKGSRACMLTASATH